MNKETLEKDVCLIVGLLSNTDPSSLTRNTVFGQDIVVDSMAAMTINAALTEKYEHAPSYSEVCNAHCIGDLIDKIAELNS